METAGFSRPALHPVDADAIQSVGYRENAPAAPAWDSMPSGASSGSKTNGDVELILGNQQYYRSDVKQPSMGKKSSSDAGVALNFERASIREVVKVVLGDILKQTYTVEPGVEGEVTINSTDPIPRDTLIPTLESLLQTQGAVLYKDDTGNYRVASRANLKGRGFMPSAGSIKPGYGLQVITLRYIPAAEMQKILEPIASPDAFVRVDPNRNMLVLAGTSSELANLMATIKTFDVDVLKGMSVGIYRVKNVEAAVVAKNLDALFGESGSSPMAGMIKIMPIEHMNSIMIISANPDYLKDMKDWVDRFDQVSPTAGQQLFVYHVQNGDAENLADMLNQIFGGKKSGTKGALPGGGGTSSLAPGLEAATVGGGDGQSAKAAPARTMLGDSGGGVDINPDAEVRIVADKTNNSLMVMSTEDTYQQILEALKRLDVMPMQVQVEASIMEVSLTGGLEYGLQWYFKNNAFGKNGSGMLDLDSSSGLSAAVPGFSYSLTGANGAITGVLNALARESKLRVISSPSVLVLDNQTANIRVGNQQPVFTGSSTTDGGVVTQNVQFKDTGVSLQVTPHVNSSGLVKMDIQQDVTDVGEIDQATGQRSFLQRNIKSNIAVKSGETIVLGGLIRDNSTDGKSGLPGLSKVPVVGNLFSGTSHSGVRTELLVLITPTAISSQRDLVKTGEEMRDRMRSLMDGDKFFPQLRGQYEDK
ncbi:type II secretion system secretin GspD [Candidatus Thiothrix sp. Deng01]|uniref:Type II secretion system secretin GspD n=1 Tax=Candidatus Thiothrix phosphatis TaxID=3112415 RepID=A0ABU6CWS8_9GAMM|nr:type II secretion system secretin GspD [Candidatus Thiothrix sp. Deng01]MEB4591002.1 type II secretion system secretin GspD [Candidatus Thiothrix sp. Deng01]